LVTSQAVVSPNAVDHPDAAREAFEQQTERILVPLTERR
jgi:hypothetical protein